jgi:hypothetical protein
MAAQASEDFLIEDVRIFSVRLAMHARRDELSLLVAFPIRG